MNIHPDVHALCHAASRIRQMSLLSACVLRFRSSTYIRRFYDVKPNVASRGKKRPNIFMQLERVIEFVAIFIVHILQEKVFLIEGDPVYFPATINKDHKGVFC